MKNEQLEVLERIFSDAHIIDVDFSEWDKKISICLLADHYRVYRKNKPVLIITFFKVHELIVKFNHFDIVLDNPNDHFQWIVDEFDIKKNKGLYEIIIFGPIQFPKLSLNCESIEIEEIPIKWLDKFFPGWSKPSAPLARLGISKMIDNAKRGVARH